MKQAMIMGAIAALAQVSLGEEATVRHFNKKSHIYMSEILHS